MEQDTHNHQQSHQIHDPTKAEIQQKHHESQTKYPGLDLLDEEYVVLDVERIWLGRARIFALIGLVALFFVVIAVMFHIVIPTSFPMHNLLFIGFLVLAVLTPFLSLVLVRDYDEDYLIVTNNRLLENIRYTVFASRNQDIGLDGVEDVSFSQKNLVEKLFGYGTVRLSTIGDEQTYIFPWVKNPAAQIKLIRHTIKQYHERHSSRKHGY